MRLMWTLQRRKAGQELEGNKGMAPMRYRLRIGFGRECSLTRQGVSYHPSIHTSVIDIGNSICISFSLDNRASMHTFEAIAQFPLSARSSRMQYSLQIIAVPGDSERDGMWRPVHLNIFAVSLRALNAIIASSRRISS